MKKIIFLLALFFVIPLFFVGCQNNKSSLNCYQIQAVFNDETNSLECVENIKYYNNSENALNEVCFFCIQIFLMRGNLQFLNI